MGEVTMEHHTTKPIINKNVILRMISSIVVVLLASLAFSPIMPITHVAAQSDQNGLFEQSARVILRKDFSDPDLSYLLMDARTGSVIAERWNDDEQSVPGGSLVKPFTALAYADVHHGTYPKFDCKGNAGNCWLPQGHGHLGIEKAIAQSCNAYFRQLASDISVEQFNATMKQFGLMDAHAIDADGMIGRGSAWQMTPVALGHAYLQLIERRKEQSVADVLDGMARSAQAGTGSALKHRLNSESALAKTGTAVCTHERKAPGDGFTVAMVPADSPRLLLLVRMHGVPGARAADTAGRILAQLEYIHADASTH